jgi:hypothetical protein
MSTLERGGKVCCGRPDETKQGVGGIVKKNFGGKLDDKTAICTMNQGCRTKSF